MNEGMQHAENHAKKGHLDKHALSCSDPLTFTGPVGAIGAGLRLFLWSRKVATVEKVENK